MPSSLSSLENHLDNDFDSQVVVLDLATADAPLDSPLDSPTSTSVFSNPSANNSSAGSSYLHSELPRPDRRHLALDMLTTTPFIAQPLPNPPIAFVPKAQADMSTVSQQIGVRPTAGLSWRPPSPPHLHIPAASEEAPIKLPDYQGFAESDEELQILRTITQANTAAPQTEWKYENRRAAQSILSFLHLGPSAAARDVEYIRNNKITMLLAIRNTASAHARLLSGDKVAAQMGIDCGAVDVEGNQQLIAAFPNAIKAINDHLIKMYRLRESGADVPEGKVLVFCESGNERSAAVVAAYLMASYGVGTIAAIQYIQTQRFCVAFDDGLKYLCKAYCSIQLARFTVEQARGSAPNLQSSVAPAPSKRRRDEDEDDMDIDGADDIERFGNRAGFVPFVDIDE